MRIPKAKPSFHAGTRYATLIVSIMRSAQLKRGLVSVARGLDKAMEEDEQLRIRFREHATRPISRMSFSASFSASATTTRCPLPRI